MTDKTLGLPIWANSFLEFTAIMKAISDTYITQEHDNNKEIDVN